MGYIIIIKLVLHKLQIPTNAFRAGVKIVGEKGGGGGGSPAATPKFPHPHHQLPTAWWLVIPCGSTGTTNNVGWDFFFQTTMGGHGETFPMAPEESVSSFAASARLSGKKTGIVEVRGFFFLWSSLARFIAAI